MPDIPILYGPGGRPVVVQPDEAKVREAQKDAVLVELWGLLNGEPNTLQKWGQVGGYDEAIQALSLFIVELIGKEVIERRLNCVIQVQERQAPTPGDPEVKFVPAPDATQAAAAQMQQLDQQRQQPAGPGTERARRRWFGR